MRERRIADQLRRATGYGWSYNWVLAQWDSKDGAFYVRRVGIVGGDVGDSYGVVYMMYGPGGEAEKVGGSG